MVCTIGNPYSKLQDYAEENLYTKEQTILNSRWLGKGASNLGITGYVTPKDYEKAYRGLDRAGNSLRQQQANKKSRSGRDLTFSAPKSVSLLALLEPKAEIINAHHQAINRALEYVEQNCVFTRIGKGGREKQQTDNMIVAVFQHSDSRNFDPNLHSHCVVFNQTQGKDGKWRSMDNHQLYSQKMTIGMVYRYELGRQLSELGHSINWNQDGTFDIAGFNSKQLSHFSSRRTEIIDAVGIESSVKEKAKACISTRNTKRYISIDERDTIHKSWQHKFDSLGLTVPQPTTHSDKPKGMASLRIFDTKDLERSRQKSIDNSIQTLDSRDGKTRFLEHELLREILVQAQGQHQLDKLQHDVKHHPGLIGTEDGKLTTIDLYRKEKIRLREAKQIASKTIDKPDILELATLTFEQKTSPYQDRKDLNSDSKIFNFKEIKDPHSRISQAVQEYLRKSDRQQSKTVILTDTEEDRYKITSRLRQELIKQNKLESNAIRTNILHSKNLDTRTVLNIENYQIGNAVKFDRTSKRFNNKDLYKVVEIDLQNGILHLIDRFHSEKKLPLHRYKHRQVYQAQKRELRVNEKMHFLRSQYINGNQVSAGQSFTITNIKNKQRITIKTKGKLSIVKADDLLFSEYNYVDTLKKHQGKKIDSCIYHPSTAKSNKLFKQDIYKVASYTKRGLTVYTSDNFLQQNTTIKAQVLQPSMKLKGKSEVQHIDESQAINNTLFELASSSKYIALNRKLDILNSADRQVYNSPDGIVIEKNLQNLSIYYDDKLINFDRDFNVTKNEFSNQEIHQLNQKVSDIKQQSVEQNQNKQIQKDIGLSL
ncbi:relaxase domain-containing protein [Waterburya agarophytonicola K14]|uniref:Relaxase domain-containing protein n=1 Tax=Waterburya agarophytonicola KI4 TaxID=2874699 RepID=A0A964BQ31_9CYAN|nr:MobF family relaxase [Waterburya agarophytonicola]MCC0175835.1 relaxase domain-containing protein [Waterburya agarophytonicola KI4]